MQVQDAGRGWPTVIRLPMLLRSHPELLNSATNNIGGSQPGVAPCDVDVQQALQHLVLLVARKMIERVLAPAQQMQGDQSINQKVHGSDFYGC
jgi:hypothetical protein